VAVVMQQPPPDVTLLGLSIPAAIAAAVISTLGGVLGGWVRDSYVAHRRRPRLTILGYGAHREDSMRVLYLTVENQGRTTATGCTAQMSIVSPTHGPLPPMPRLPAEVIGHPDGIFADIPVPWFHDESPTVLSIHPTQRQRLIVGGYSYETHALRIPSPTTLTPPRLEIRGHLGYDFVVRIGADNAATTLAGGRVADDSPDALKITPIPLVQPWWPYPRQRAGFIPHTWPWWERALRLRRWP
jgi:hypothetical protein